MPKRDVQKRRSRFSRFLFWVLFLGFLGVCVYLFLFSPFLEIDSVAVEGNRDIPSEEIIQGVEETMSGKYFNCLSKRNFFLSSRKAINNKLKNEFNRLEISSIEKKFPRVILIKVKEREPELAWCSGGVCYLADKEGFVYAGANAADEELNRNRFLIVIDDSARPVEIGKTVINPDFILYLKQMDGVIIDDLGFQVDGNYHTPALASQEVLVKIREGEGWVLKLNKNSSPAETKKIIQKVFEKELDE